MKISNSYFLDVINVGVHGEESSCDECHVEV